MSIVIASSALRSDMWRVAKKTCMWWPGTCERSTTNIVSCFVTPVRAPSISVCPRCSEPACQIASLLMGPVTMPAICWSIAAVVAISIARTAARPARASTTPHSSCSSPSTSMSKTSMTPAPAEGTSHEDTVRTSASRPRTSTARRMTDASATAMPWTESSPACSWRTAAVISGPMPTGSPGVSARTGAVMRIPSRKRSVMKRCERGQRGRRGRRSRCRCRPPARPS